jgi:L-histidine N-alpha-methyltransferase
MGILPIQGSVTNVFPFGNETMIQETAYAAADLRFQLRLEALPTAGSFAEDVRRGLTASPKLLSPKYFYDALGSRLFEAICELPEYYVTRAETEVFRDHAGEIAAALPGRLRLVELGSGDAQKTRLLIEAVLTRQGDLDYLPIDISRSAIEQSSDRLLGSYPELRVTAYLAEYQDALRSLRHEPLPRGVTRTLVLFLGSTIGNLGPGERAGLLRDIRGILRPGDGLLLGTDLKKEEAVLLAAYDDALGVTAAFNLNLLVRINRELGGTIDPTTFRHRARYDREKGRIEMHLESRRDQVVSLRSLGLEVGFARGETIHTESSYKFDLHQIAELAARTGFEPRRTWTDGGRRFGSHLLVAR